MSGGSKLSMLLDERRAQRHVWPNRLVGQMGFILLLVVVVLVVVVHIVIVHIVIVPVFVVLVFIVFVFIVLVVVDFQVDTFLIIRVASSPGNFILQFIPFFSFRDGFHWKVSSATTNFER